MIPDVFFVQVHLKHFEPNSRSGLLQMTKLKGLDSSNLDSTSNPTRLVLPSELLHSEREVKLFNFYSPW